MASAAGTDVKQLLLQVDASVELLRKNLLAGDQAVEQFERNSNRRLASIDRGFTGLGGTVQKISGQISFGMRTIAASIGLVSTAALARGLLSVADEAKNLNAQLKLATAQSGSFATAQADVRRIAEQTRSGLAETAKLYGNFQRNAEDLGISQRQSARATETVAKSFKISGAGAEEAAQGTRQLVQALQSGTLRGDEFNSIMENSPRLARLLADSLGVPIGSLRAMAEAGELTSDKLVKAFTDKRFTAGIDAEFAQLPVTIDQAMEQIHNAAIITFGAFDRGGDFSSALANFITDGTAGFGDLEHAAENFGISTRGNIEGLRDVFEPLANAGKAVFDFLTGESAKTGLNIRRDIQESLDFLDAIANRVRLVRPDEGFSLARGLGFPMPESNMGEVFRRSSAASDIEQRLRLIMGSPVEGVAGGGAGGGPRAVSGGKRSAEQAFRDFEAALARQGVQRAAGRTGFRTAQDQNAIYRAGQSNLDGYRTPSRHQAWQALDPTRGSHSEQAAYRAAQEAGLKGFRIVTESGSRKHYEWTGHGKPGDPDFGRGGRGPSAETLAKREESARVAAERRQQAFDNALADINRDLLDARGALVNSAELAAQLEKQNIEVERVKYNDNLVSQVSQKKLTQAEADQLKAINDETAALKARKVDLEEQQRLRREAAQAEHRRLEVVTGDLQSQQELLESRLSIADTTGERKDLELRLLDLQFREEEIRLKAIIAESERLNAIEHATEQEKQAARDAAAAAETARGRLATADERRTNATVAVSRQNLTPMEEYRERLKRDVGDIGEALERVQVNTFQQLEQDIAGAAREALGLKGALGDVVEQLIRMGLQMLQLEAMGGAQGGGGGAGGLLGSVLGALGLGGGGSPASVIGYADAGGGSIPLYGFAGGGEPPVGRVSLVGERGPELFVPKVPGRIVPNHMLRSGGSAAPQSTTVNVYAQDAVLAETVRGWVRKGVEDATLAGAGLAHQHRQRNHMDRDR